jgi:zinc/manganese transport system substrate-binding protein
MHKLFLGLVSIVLLAADAATAEAKLSVVTTIPDFAAVVRELGGDRVNAESLLLGTEDPHFVDAKPSHVLRVNRADLVILVGLGLESGWLPSLLGQARNPKVQPGSTGYLDASQFVQLKDAPVSLDRSMGDIHAGGNPHYYTSPFEMLRVAEAIYHRLTELDGEGRAAYDQRWQVFSRTMQEKVAAWKARLAPFAGTRVVEYHKSWVYLLDWVGFVSAGALEPKPGIPPSPAHVSELLNVVRDQQVRFVIKEIYYPDRLAQVFADKAGAKLLVLPSMVGALPGINTLWDKWDRVVAMLVDNPGGG